MLQLELQINVLYLSGFDDDHHVTGTNLIDGFCSPSYLKADCKTMINDQ